MIREKSCGAVIFRTTNGQLEYLIVRSTRGNHWAFPKGHMEPGENEQDTALREIFEETGLKVRLLDGFRTGMDYPLREGCCKEVVVFLGDGAGQAVTVPEDEISDFRWLAYPAAISLLSYENSRAILAAAQAFLATLPRP
jgi:bis(5'-nucleosidyl)-tetraphosphatase